MKRIIENIFLLTIVTAYFLWFALPLVSSASDNLRLVSAFSTDESLHLNLIKEAIEKNTFKMDFYYYGQLYYNLALLPLLAVSYFTQVSEQQIIIVLRMIPTLFAIATVLVTFIFTRRYFGSLAAWLAVFLLSIVPLEFLNWSVVSHPDVPQMLFLVLGMYFCCLWGEEKHLKWLIVASACSGLAFACKYSGVFLLFVIWIIGIIQTIIEGDNERFEINIFHNSNATRYITATIGLLLIIIGVILSYEFAERYLSVTGSIDDSLKIIFLNRMRIISILIGCVLIILSIPKFIWLTIKVSKKTSSILNKIIISAITFCLSFIISSPFSLYKFNIVKGLYLERRHLATGEWFIEEKSGIKWFHILFSSPLLDQIILFMIAISIFVFAYKVVRGNYRSYIPASILWLFVIIYGGFLIFQVGMHRSHYLLPIIPFLIILSIQPLNEFVKIIKDRFSKNNVFVLLFSLIFLICGFEFHKSFNRILEFRESVINQVENSNSVRAGQWLARNYSSTTRILYDYYSYVPPSFMNAYGHWGELIPMLSKIDPDIVIVNHAIAGHFDDISKAKLYVTGEYEFWKRFEFYKALRDGKYGYKLVQDFEDVQIYEKIR